MKPYLGEIRMFGGDFAPVGWAQCQGQELAASGFPDLFGLLGTSYGGDGETSFGLPDLSGRVAVGAGQACPLAEGAGEEQVTLQVAQLPTHAHVLTGSTAPASSSSPAGAVAASAAGPALAYGDGQPVEALDGSSIAYAGGSQAHPNMQPWLCVSFIICLDGVVPGSGQLGLDTPFVGEIRLLPYGYAPVGWTTANGQMLPIREEIPLFEVLGTTYGGDGKATFALPGMTDRVAVGAGESSSGTTYRCGDSGGDETVALTGAMMGGHTHALNASYAAAITGNPSGQLFAAGVEVELYGPDSGASGQLAAQALVPAGGSQPHNNMQPYLGLQHCIAMQGTVPQRAG